MAVTRRAINCRLKENWRHFLVQAGILCGKGLAFLNVWEQFPVSRGPGTGHGRHHLHRQHPGRITGQRRPVGTGTVGAVRPAGGRRVHRSIKRRKEPPRLLQPERHPLDRPLSGLGGALRFGAGEGGVLLEGRRHQHGGRAHKGRAGTVCTHILLNVWRI